jgi:hypothetical protein
VNYGLAGSSDMKDKMLELSVHVLQEAGFIDCISQQALMQVHSRIFLSTMSCTPSMGTSWDGSWESCVAHFKVAIYNVWLHVLCLLFELELSGYCCLSIGRLWRL